MKLYSVNMSIRSVFINMYVVATMSSVVEPMTTKISTVYLYGTTVEYPENNIHPIVVLLFVKCRFQ